MPPVLDHLRHLFKTGHYNITRHGFEKMGLVGLTTALLEEALGDDDPEIIEDYPEDPRGPSCLILGWCASGDPIHACVGYGYKGEKPELITVYRPSLENFCPGFRRRRKNAKS